MNIPHPLQSSLTTPPESFTNAPLTPPPTEEKPNLPVLSRILKEIARRERGHNFSTQPWERLEVSESEYKTLLPVLQGDGFAKHKLRYGSNKEGLVRLADIGPQIRLFSVY
jgi:hypothetical protein